MKAECLKCGKANGPNVPLGADYAGWICGKCYGKMLAADYEQAAQPHHKEREEQGE